MLLSVTLEVFCTVDVYLSSTFWDHPHNQLQFERHALKSASTFPVDCIVPLCWSLLQFAWACGIGWPLTTSLCRVVTLHCRELWRFVTSWHAVSYSLTWKSHACRVYHAARPLTKPFFWHCSGCHSQHHLESRLGVKSLHIVPVLWARIMLASPLSWQLVRWEWAKYYREPGQPLNASYQW